MEWGELKNWFGTKQRENKQQKKHHKNFIAISFIGWKTKIFPRLLPHPHRSNYANGFHTLGFIIWAHCPISFLPQSHINCFALHFLLRFFKQTDLYRTLNKPHIHTHSILPGKFFCALEKKKRLKVTTNYVIPRNYLGYLIRVLYPVLKKQLLCNGNSRTWIWNYLYLSWKLYLCLEWSDATSLSQVLESITLLATWWASAFTRREFRIRHECATLVIASLH